MLEFFKGPFLRLIFSHYNLPFPIGDAICDIDMYADYTALYSEFESDLQDTMD